MNKLREDTPRMGHHTGTWFIMSQRYEYLVYMLMQLMGKAEEHMESMFPLNHPHSEHDQQTYYYPIPVGLMEEIHALIESHGLTWRNGQPVHLENVKDDTVSQNT